MTLTLLWRPLVKSACSMLSCIVALMTARSSHAAQILGISRNPCVLCDLHGFPLLLEDSRHLLLVPAVPQTRIVDIMVQFCFRVLLDVIPACDLTLRSRRSSICLQTHPVELWIQRQRKDEHTFSQCPAGPDTLLRAEGLGKKSVGALPGLEDLGGARQDSDQFLFFVICIYVLGPMILLHYSHGACANLEKTSYCSTA